MIRVMQANFDFASLPPSQPVGRLRVLFITACMFIAAAALRAAPAPSADVHSRALELYLNGKWDELSTFLNSNAGAVAKLPPPDKADVDYIRRSMLECKPAWWKQCKAGEKIHFRPLVWGHSIVAAYDAQPQTNIRLNFVNGAASAVFSWDAKEMDNPEPIKELPFTKGEKQGLDIWGLIGIADSDANIAPHFQLSMTDAQRAALNRFLDFRANITGTYYATPPARRLAIWLSISAWSHEYDQAPTMVSRRCVGILLVEEVLGHPEAFPSVPWPEMPPAEGAQSKMVWALQEWIRNHPLPLAEDRAFRDAVKSFAAANASEPRFRQTGQITLPNGLSIALDPAADKPLETQRDAWIIAQYAKGRPPHP